MKIYIAIVLISSIIMSARGTMPGGISDDEKPATDDVKSTVSKVASEIKTTAMASLTTSGGQANNAFKDAKVEVLSYKTQVVAGTNIFAKVKIAGMIFHARIYKDLDGNVSLNKVIGPRKESDPIGYF